MDISIVVPLYNEVESIPELVEWIRRVLMRHSYTFEILLIDDGSHDGSWQEVERLAATYSTVKGIKFRRNYGKSAALNIGFQHSTGDVIITMDADLQDSPEEIPELVEMIHKQGYDIVSGWKMKRHDPVSKTIPTKLYNWATRRMSGVRLHDFNCGLKAYKKEVIKTIEVYGEMHRYIPVIAKWAGFKKIGEKVVLHQKRKYGTTKFGMSRFVNGFLDLLSISFVGRFGRRPMHLFGLLGTILFVVGFAIAIYLAYAKIVLTEYRMTDRPLFYFGMLAMILGTQLFLTGFLAEMISRNSHDRNNYFIEKKINA